MTEQTQDVWAYKVAYNIAREIYDGTSELISTIEEEDGPETLIEQIEGIEGKLDELREELHEMPSF